MPISTLFLAAGDVLLVRHGQIQSNLDRRYAGHSPEPLTPVGRQEIQQVAAQLRPLQVASLHSSCIARAMESAAIIGAQIGISPQPDARLNELSMGPWQGLTEDDILRQFPSETATWLSRPAELRLPGRETLDELADRVMGAVRDIALRETPAVCVTHVAPIRVAVLRALGRSLNDYKKLHVGNANIFVVRHTDGLPVDVLRFAPSGELERVVIPG